MCDVCAKYTRQMGEDPVGALTGMLREGCRQGRADAAWSLRDYGPDAVPPLCEALRSRYPRVRWAAVCSLGGIGDMRAVEPLNDLVWRVTMGKSFLATALAVCLTPCAFCSWSFFFWDAVSVVLVPVLFAGVVGAVWSWNRRRGCEFIEEAAIALMEIAERNPGAEARAVLHDLQCVAADPIRYPARTRRIAEAASQEIDALTLGASLLPRPAPAPPPDGDHLPRAAETAEPEAAELPRV